MSQQLEASDPGPAGIDAFGTAISMSGDLAAIGAFYDSFSTAFSPYSGSAYVFERQGSAWSETRKLFAPTPVSLGYFGHGVGAADDRVVIGSPFEQVDGARTGAAYVYARDEGGAGNWGLAATLLSEDPNADDQLGHAVAIDGGLVFAGAIGDDDPQASSGSVEIYDFGPAISQPYVSYCTAGTSAGGCNALLSACGVASASAASGFRVTATGVEGGKDGLYFFGVNGRQSTAWGNGTSYQCVVPPVRRGALLEGAGTSGSCDGGFTYDLNAHWSAKPAQNPGVGAVVDTQLWFRDPQNSSNQTTSLSNAIEVTVEP
jgi:hypothetical protein